MGSHPSCTPTGHRLRAFTLVELVMVVTIIGIIAAIAVPRMATASARAGSNALQATLRSVRTSIECYYAEHDRYPGYNPITGTPDGDQFVNQLLIYTDFGGRTNAALTAPYIFGPYLRAPFPRNPANGLDTVFVKATRADADPAAGTYGWIAVLSNGDFGIFATDGELDSIGVEEANRKADARIK